VKLAPAIRVTLERIARGETVRPPEARPLITRGLVVPDGRKYKLTEKGEKEVARDGSR
jgi:hypothetical protein